MTKPCFMTVWERVFYRFCQNRCFKKTRNAGACATQKKPETATTSGTTWQHRSVGCGWWGHGTRGNGWGATVRTLGVHHGTPPGGHFWVSYSGKHYQMATSGCLTVGNTTKWPILVSLQWETLPNDPFWCPYSGKHYQMTPFWCPYSGKHYQMTPFTMKPGDSWRKCRKSRKFTKMDEKVVNFMKITKNGQKSSQNWHFRHSWLASVLSWKRPFLVFFVFFMISAFSALFISDISGISRCF